MYGINNVIFGILAIVVGVVTLKYNFQIVNSTARMEFIEDHLGAGTTFLVYKLLSILIVLGGALYLTGLYHAVALWLLKPFASFFQSGSN